MHFRSYKVKMKLLNDKLLLITETLWESFQLTLNSSYLIIQTICLALLLSKEPQMLVFCSPTSFYICAVKSPPTIKLALFPHHQHKPEVVKVKVHGREQTVGDNATAKRSLNVIYWKMELDFCQAGMLRWSIFHPQILDFNIFFLQRWNWLDWKDVQTFDWFRLPKCQSEKRRRISLFKKYNSQIIELLV